jgi:hypothetical protein
VADISSPVWRYNHATEVRVKRLLPMAILCLAAAAPAQAQERQCWLDAMSDAEKRALVIGYAEMQRTDGRARADAWAQAQRAAYIEKFASRGVCPLPRTGSAQEPTPSPEPQLLNRAGKPCKRIELENQNVPNIGGAMGWALIPVCKD